MLCLGTQTSGRLGPRKVEEGGEEKECKYNTFLRVLCDATIPERECK